MMATPDFSQWLDTYEYLYEDPSKLPDTPCPDCGVRGKLRLIFVTGGSDPDTVLAEFWCDACLVGLIPLRAPLPPHGELVKRGEEVVPDYRLVVADPDDE